MKCETYEREFEDKDIIWDFIEDVLLATICPKSNKLDK